MATLASLDAVRFETIAKQSATLLDEILKAKTRETVAAAQERARKYLLDLIDTGDICVNDARNLRAVQDMVVAVHLLAPLDQCRDFAGGQPEELLFQQNRPISACRYWLKSTQN